MNHPNEKQADETKDSSSPPKRDKFAAMALRQQQEQSSTITATESSPPPKRDKFAAMAAMQSTSEDTTETTTATATSHRRDKFASVAAQQQQQTPDTQTLPQQKEQEEEAVQRRLEQRCAQRDAVWKDLDRAEALTVRLLDIAQETCQRLADQTDLEALRTLSQDYSTTLTDLYGCLQPHAGLVQAYQDYSTQQPQEQQHMYASRVELRIANSRHALLQNMVQLEQEQQQQQQASSSGSMEMG